MLAQRPEESPRPHARSARAARAFPGYARLMLCSIPGWMLVVYLLAQGLDVADAETRLSTALTFWQAFGPILLDPARDGRAPYPMDDHRLRARRASRCGKTRTNRAR